MGNLPQGLANYMANKKKAASANVAAAPTPKPAKPSMQMASSKVGSSVSKTPVSSGKMANSNVTLGVTMHAPGKGTNVNHPC